MGVYNTSNLIGYSIINNARELTLEEIMTEYDIDHNVSKKSKEKNAEYKEAEKEFKHRTNFK